MHPENISGRTRNNNILFHVQEHSCHVLACSIAGFPMSTCMMNISEWKINWSEIVQSLCRRQLSASHEIIAINDQLIRRSGIEQVRRSKAKDFGNRCRLNSWTSNSVPRSKLQNLSDKKWNEVIASEIPRTVTPNFNTKSGHFPS